MVTVYCVHNTWRPRGGGNLTLSPNPSPDRVRVRSPPLAREKGAGGMRGLNHNFILKYDTFTSSWYYNLRA